MPDLNRYAARLTFNHKDKSLVQEPPSACTKTTIKYTMSERYNTSISRAKRSHLWLSVLLKDGSVMTVIRTNISTSML